MQMQNQLSSEMLSQYEKFMQFQQFMEMQKKAGDGDINSTTQHSEIEQKVLDSGTKSQKQPILKTKVEDKENVEPVARNVQQMEPPTAKTKSVASALKKGAVPMMPAGDSSDEEKDQAQNQSADDSFEFAQKLVEQEKKSRKRIIKKDRKNDKIYENPVPAGNFDAYDDILNNQEKQQKSTHDRKQIQAADKNRSLRDKENDFEIDFNGEFHDSFSASKIISDPSDMVMIDQALRASASPFQPKMQAKMSDDCNSADNYDGGEVIKNALLNLQSDSNTVDLLKQIVDQLQPDQKVEILAYFDYSLTENDDLQQYKKIIEDTKAERIKLQNANRQQQTFIENLQQKNKEYQMKLRMMETERDEQRQGQSSTEKKWDQNSRMTYKKDNQEQKQKYNEFEKGDRKHQGLRENRGIINQERGGAKIHSTETHQFDHNKPRMTYNDKFIQNQKEAEQKQSQYGPQSWKKNRSNQKFEQQSVDEFQSKNSSQVSKKSEDRLSETDRKALREFMLQSQDQGVQEQPRNTSSQIKLNDVSKFSATKPDDTEEYNVTNFTGKKDSKQKKTISGSKMDSSKPMKGSQKKNTEGVNQQYSRVDNRFLKKVDPISEKENQQDLSESIPVIDVSRISGGEEPLAVNSKNVSFSAKNESVNENDSDMATPEKPEEKWNNLLRNVMQSTPGASQVEGQIHNFYEEEEEEMDNQWAQFGNNQPNEDAEEEVQKPLSKIEESLDEDKKVSDYEVEDGEVVEEKITKQVKPELGFETAGNEIPKVMTSVSPYAEGIIAQLQKALDSKNGEELSNLVFDAECEGLENQIDLNWWEQRAAEIIQNDL